MNRFGQFLFYYRKYNNLTLKQVAEETNYAISFLSMVENSERKVPFDMPFRMIKQLDMTDKAKHEFLVEGIKDTHKIYFKTEYSFHGVKGVDFIADFIIKYPTLSQDKIDKMHKILEEE